MQQPIRKLTCGAGDAVYIHSNKKHGIKNIGTEVLQYLTANSPAFSEEYENRLWTET
jgi:oxalate decarboxylase/phosphoglucose isomerase-like protein (cupin superfamily)